MTRIAMAAVMLVLVSACAMQPPPPPLPAGTESAKLRVAVKSVYATNIGIGRVPEQSCSASSEYLLGWFHPSVSGDFQSGRRLYNLRASMSVPATVPPHLHAEHQVAVGKPFFVRYQAALTNCAGVTRLDLKPGREYEFLLTIDKGVCEPQLFELSAPSSRTEVPVPESTTGAMCRL
jgi:hypothetical protein